MTDRLLTAEEVAELLAVPASVLDTRVDALRGDAAPAARPLSPLPAHQRASAQLEECSRAGRSIALRWAAREPAYDSRRQTGAAIAGTPSPPREAVVLARP